MYKDTHCRIRETFPLHPFFCNTKPAIIMLIQRHGRPFIGIMTGFKASLSPCHIATDSFLRPFGKIQAGMLQCIGCCIGILFDQISSHLFCSCLGRTADRSKPCIRQQPCLKLFPKTPIHHIRVRTALPGHIIVPQYMIQRDRIPRHQIPDQFLRRSDCCRLKIPVRVSCPHAGGVPFTDAQLHTDAVGIPAVWMVVVLRPAMPCYILFFHTLPYLPVMPDKIMRRRPDVPARIISAVILCASECTHIMDHDIFHTAPRPDVTVDRIYQSIDLHQTPSSPSNPIASGSKMLK